MASLYHVREAYQLSRGSKYFEAAKIKSERILNTRWLSLLLSPVALFRVPSRAALCDLLHHALPVVTDPSTPHTVDRRGATPDLVPSTRTRRRPM
jgi:hypothetical protein